MSNCIIYMFSIPAGLQVRRYSLFFLFLTQTYWANTQDFVTYHISLHTQSMDVNEGSNQYLDL